MLRDFEVPSAHTPLRSGHVEHAGDSCRVRAFALCRIANDIAATAPAIRLSCSHASLFMQAGAHHPRSAAALGRHNPRRRI
jgi:hypothetical protein